MVFFGLCGASTPLASCLHGQEDSSDPLRAKVRPASRRRAVSPIVIALLLLALASIPLVVVAIKFRPSPPSKSVPSKTSDEKKPGEPRIVDLLKGEAKAPSIGRISFGAFAGEAALVAGIKTSSIPYLHDVETYRKYRQSVRNVYGVDLMDMNYFSIGNPRWERRASYLQGWLLRAGEFGEVTVAIEPIGPDGYGVFHDSPGMRRLRKAFEAARDAKIKVVVRFASEANLFESKYSAIGSQTKSYQFYNAACWFKKYMPQNVELVFSPLINTVFMESRRQQSAIRWMFLGPSNGGGFVPWDRIGGTIYRTDLSLKPTYAKYYQLMSKYNDKLPFQICELGGPYRSRDELLSFISEAVAGAWPRLEKVNLFARNINRRADPAAEFGFIEPRLRADAIFSADNGQIQYPPSFLKPLFDKE